MGSAPRQLPVLDAVAAGAAGLGIGYGLVLGRRLLTLELAIAGAETFLLLLAVILIGGWLLAAWGIWVRASWGRIVTILLAALMAVSAAGALVGSGDVDVASGASGTSVLTMAAALAVAGYLSHPDVEEAFS